MDKSIRDILEMNTLAFHKYQDDFQKTIDKIKESYISTGSKRQLKKYKQLKIILKEYIRLYELYVEE